MTPSTCSCFTASHIDTATGPTSLKFGVSPRLRQSWLGSNHPHRAARSPLIGTAPFGTSIEPVSTSVPSFDVAVGEGDGSGLQEHAGPGSHLCVVGDQQQVVRRALEDLVQRPGDDRRVLETGLDLLHLVDELVVPAGQRAEKAS